MEDQCHPPPPQPPKNEEKNPIALNFVEHNPFIITTNYCCIYRFYTVNCLKSREIISALLLSRDIFEEHLGD